MRLKLRHKRKGCNKLESIIYTEDNLKEVLEFCNRKEDGTVHIRAFNYGSLVGDLQVRLKEGFTYVSYGDTLKKDNEENIMVIPKEAESVN